VRRVFFFLLRAAALNKFVKGQFRVLNLSMAPSFKLDFFNSPEFCYWNTNNLWVSVQALHRILQEDKVCV
jgi:UDP-N-acetylglucosamine pyrophosphorylase